MTRSLSLAHLSMLDAGPLELIDAAAAGGFDAVGMRIWAPWHSPLAWQVVGNPQMMRDVRTRLNDTGLVLQDVESFSLTDTVDVESFRPAIEAGADLGARQVLTAGNDDDGARLADRFAMLCEIAAESGVRVSLEFIPYCATNNLSAARTLLKRAGSANAGLLLDVLHLSRSGGSPADLDDVDPSEITLLHLCDAAAAIPTLDKLPDEARNRRFYPGEGTLPLSDVLGRIRHDVPIGVESPCAEFAHLPPPERAIRIGHAARKVLAPFESGAPATATNGASS